MIFLCLCCSFFFFNDTATTEIYTTVHTLSLHDALPISADGRPSPSVRPSPCWPRPPTDLPRSEEHTSELQSRTVISYAVVCLKKKKGNAQPTHADSARKKQNQHTPHITS